MSSFPQMLRLIALYIALNIHGHSALNQPFHCNASDDCSYICDTPSSCSSASIYLDTDSTLDLQCTDAFSCSSLSINASSNTHAFINCTAASSCFNLTYSGSASLNSSITMQCSSAASDSSCAEVTVIGGWNASIEVTCDGRYDCDGITLDGRDASLLAVYNCSAYESCWSMTIWCPEHLKGEKRCILEGDDNGWDYDGWGPITLYAVNSWQDVEFVTLESSILYQGIMHCTGDWDEWCRFGDYFQWQCNDVDAVCFNTTLHETAAPTTYPTNEPTMEPTLDPTADPTEDPSPAPSFAPSAAPTMDPSESPSSEPTVFPTITPSGSPTMEPSSDPTTPPIATVTVPSSTLNDSVTGSVNVTTANNNAMPSEEGSDLAQRNAIDNSGKSNIWWIVLIVVLVVGCLFMALLYGMLKRKQWKETEKEASDVVAVSQKDLDEEEERVEDNDCEKGNAAGSKEEGKGKGTGNEKEEEIPMKSSGGSSDEETPMKNGGGSSDEETPMKSGGGSSDEESINHEPSPEIMLHPGKDVDDTHSVTQISQEHIETPDAFED